MKEKCGMSVLIVDLKWNWKKSKRNGEIEVGIEGKVWNDWWNVVWKIVEIEVFCLSFERESECREESEKSLSVRVKRSKGLKWKCVFCVFLRVFLEFWSVQKFQPVMTCFRHSGTALATTKIDAKIWTHGTMR